MHFNQSMKAHYKRKTQVGKKNSLQLCQAANECFALSVSRQLSLQATENIPTVAVALWQ